MARKERFELRISTELLDKLNKQAGREGISRSEVVTRAIETYLAPGSIGEICSKLTGKIEALKEMLDVKS